MNPLSRNPGSAPEYIKGTFHSSLAARFFRERSGSVVECLTRDWGAAGLSRTRVTALCPWARHNYPSLAVVQTQGDPSLQNWKIVKNQIKQKTFFHLPLTIANNLDPDQDGQNAGPDPWWESKLFDTLIVFPKEFFEKVNFEKKSLQTRKALKSTTLVNVNAPVVATTSWLLHFSAPVVA